MEGSTESMAAIECFLCKIRSETSQDGRKMWIHEQNLKGIIGKTTFIMLWHVTWDVKTSCMAMFNKKKIKNKKNQNSFLFYNNTVRFELDNKKNALPVQNNCKRVVVPKRKLTNKKEK